MFKNILLCMCLLVSGNTILSANENTNYSIAIELARAKKVDLLIERINELNNSFKLYVYNTGDINANITKINNWNGNLNLVSWENYDKDQLLFSHNQRNSFFGKIFTNEPSKEVIAFLLNSNNVSPLSTIDKVNYSLTIPHDNKFMSFYKYTQELANNSNVVISDNPPSDKTKIWYKPDGNGGYEIFGWSDSEGKWISYGKIGFDNNGSGSSGNNIVVKSMDELNSIPATSGLKAYVSEGGVATEYIYDGEKWVKAGSESTGGLFNGDASILDLATSLISKSGGSKATASDVYSSGVKSNFSGVIEFTKKDNSSTKGYWVDTTNSFIVGSTMADITTQNWANGTTAYLPKTNKTSVDVLKKINGNWYYIADGYVDVAQNMNEAKKYNVLDKRNNEYFKYSAIDYWYSVNQAGVKNNQTELTSNTNSRSIFSPSSSVKYLTTINDCSNTTCNGLDSNNYYAGTKVDGMFAFYYAPSSPKKKNNLTDAMPFPNMGGLYDSGAEAGIVDGTVFIKDSINSSICYKDSLGVYYTRAKVKIPTGNLLPPARTCTTAVYTATNGSGFGTYLVLDNRVQATNWVTVPDGAGINVLGKNYTYDNTGGLDYWTDNLTMASATEIFTKGSRSQFPNVTKSLTALTIDVGGEPRYTASGVQSTIDSNFKQWFYSFSGTNRTNNLLDAIPTTNAYIDSEAISVGYALQGTTVLQKCGNYWCRIGTSQTVNDTLTNRASLIENVIY